jgi:tetratricopeptide (TPR) repeat protein
MMEKQQFLNKFEELKSPANAERWAVLQLWLVEAKSDEEIGKALDKDRSTATRKIGEICKHFGTDARGKKEKREHLVLLVRRYCKDFEVHPTLYPDCVDGDLSDRPQPLTNPKNIPTPELIPTLEFIGRDRDLTNLANLSRQAKIVLIKAGAGVGKSTLAREFLQTNFKKVIRIEMGLESGNVTPAEEKVSQILRKDFDEEPSRDFGINLDILREKLADRANPIGVLIDNLEPALDENYRFREKLRGYDALLAVLGDRDVFSFTLITSRRSLITPRARVHEYSLEGLDITAWGQYFHDCENGADSEALVQMCVAYNGNAKVMDILHGAIKNRFDGNIGTYWNRYKDALLADSELETLISVEMDWLRDNQPDAYKLLCRMGCYRYQDVKTVPFEGLICLLWDVSESQRAGVMQYLSKSSLIEVQSEYYLHPAVREIAKSRLLENKTDWDITNQKAAEFWTQSVVIVETIKDALQAFEAYYHYVDINGFEQAGKVITRHRDSKWSGWGRRETLGRSAYKLGLLQETISAINGIKNKLSNGYLLCRLCNILGDLYWLTGYVHNSIQSHEESLTIAHKILTQNNRNEEFLYDLQRLEKVSKFSLAACKQYLWEIEDSAKIFEEVILDLSLSEDFPKLIIQASFHLCYLYSCLNLQDKASNLAFITLQNLPTVKWGVWSKSHSLLLLGQTYKNLGEYQKAFDIYNSINTQFKLDNFPQINAKVLLSTAEVFRLQQDFNYALSNHLLSIKLLYKLGAKYDLAEAYFQLGLTYQAMGEHDRAEEYKAKALELFAQMEAPKQIERVNKAFGGNIQ